MEDNTNEAQLILAIGIDESISNLSADDIIQWIYSLKGVRLIPLDEVRDQLKASFFPKDVEAEPVDEIVVKDLPSTSSK